MSYKKIIVANIATLVVLVGAGFGGFYLYDQSTNYVKTDYAKVDGHKFAITAPASGTLDKWEGLVGKTFAKGDAIGEVTLPASPKQKDSKPTEVPVASPSDVTVVQNNAVKDTPTAAGTPLAYAYNMDDLYVTANLEETAIDEVSVGADVDITVDAFKDTKFKGKVEEIGLATAGEFSLLPQSNSNANYTKVTQVVPVKISIKDAKGYDILPGMNVSVRIHK